eukprot:CAMPEP_0118867092 /NCGR_PEP_ID=MMETSP1163-20130328/10799_1 /TAXON_ID=124430 /ORGANISM="Phaeomonas parva, Strain CCMP2877" /LENGTH=390 /DNA_ID=CAMNT_0006801469 /DNA_START=77 /DNA_END=1247 /DNA_ORIENTATION=+
MRRARGPRADPLPMWHHHQAVRAAGAGLPDACDTESIVWQSGSGLPELSPPARCSAGRVSKMCNEHSLILERIFAKMQGVTLLISTHHRYETLAKQLEYYSASPIVSAIIVTWHNVDVPAPRSARFGNALVRFVAPATDTLNNRFNPSLLIHTECVVIMDHDIKVDLQDLYNLYVAWQHNQYNLVGFFPRWVDEEKDGRMVYNPASTDPAPDAAPGAQPREGYALMLTKIMMMRRGYLRLYSCGNHPGESEQDPPPPSLVKLTASFHAIVDQSKNCEDVGMNFMVNAVLCASRRAAPMLVKAFTKSATSGGLTGEAIVAPPGPVQKHVVQVQRVSEQASQLELVPYRGNAEPPSRDCLVEETSGVCSWAVPLRTDFSADYKARTQTQKRR